MPSTGRDGDDGVRRHRGRRASGASIAPDRILVGGRVEEAGDGGVAPGGVGEVAAWSAWRGGLASGDEAPAPDPE